MVVRLSWLLFGIVYSYVISSDMHASKPPIIHVRKRAGSEPPKPLHLAPALANSNSGSNEHTPGSTSPRANQGTGSIHMKIDEEGIKYAITRKGLFSASRTASEMRTHHQAPSPHGMVEQAPPPPPSLKPLAAAAIVIINNDVHNAPTVREYPSPGSSHAPWMQPSPTGEHVSLPMPVGARKKICCCNCILSNCTIL